MLLRMKQYWVFKKGGRGLGLEVNVLDFSLRGLGLSVSYVVVLWC